jgi:hypothetical protein
VNLAMVAWVGVIKLGALAWRLVDRRPAPAPPEVPLRCGLCSEPLNPEKPHRHGIMTVYGAEWPRPGQLAVREPE